ncbi:MAG: hypothetical protein GYB31_16760 [Bacteroidetes bacterium]|nr:hypothetical protein [Bacteroidota bacterium]
MKKILTTLFLSLSSLCLLQAQFTTVNFDIEKNYFNEGQALPAEKPLMFTGQLPEGIDLVEIRIFPSKWNKENDLLYKASWKDYDKAQNSQFSLAVNYRLKASEQYDFYLDFYEKLNGTETAKLNSQLTELLGAYLEANLVLDDNKIKLEKRSSKMMDEMNEILQSVLSDYRTRDDSGPKTLSKTIELLLEKADDTKIESFPSDSTAQLVRQSRQTRLEEEIIGIQNSIKLELDQLFTKNWSRISFSRFVDDYETEEKRGYLSVNVGYGGVYLSGNEGTLQYGASPYLGLAIPLSNSALAPKFFRNSSITVGMFTQNFEDGQGNEVTGILVGRPFYLGLDYKLFEFVRLNAGAAFLEKTVITTNNNIEEENKELFVRPFIGLSARIDLSLRFGK